MHQQMHQKTEIANAHASKQFFTCAMTPFALHTPLTLLDASFDQDSGVSISLAMHSCFPMCSAALSAGPAQQLFWPTHLQVLLSLSAAAWAESQCDLCLLSKYMEACCKLATTFNATLHGRACLPSSI